MGSPSIQAASWVVHLYRLHLPVPEGAQVCPSAGNHTEVIACVLNKPLCTVT